MIPIWPKQKNSMKQIRRWQRILILFLLSISVFAPLIFVSNQLKSITTVGRREFIEELSKIRFKTNDLRISAIEHEDGEALKGPRLILFKDKSTDENDGVTQSNAKDKTIEFLGIGGDKHKNRQEQVIVAKQTIVSSDAKDQLANKTGFKSPLSKIEKNTKVQPDRATNVKIKKIRDKIIQAKAYLNFAPLGSSSHIVRDLRARTRELERAVGDVTKDKDFSKG